MGSKFIYGRYRKDIQRGKGGPDGWQGNTHYGGIHIFGKNADDTSRIREAVQLLEQTCPIYFSKARKHLHIIVVMGLTGLGSTYNGYMVFRRRTVVDESLRQLAARIVVWSTIATFVSKGMIYDIYDSKSARGKRVSLLALWKGYTALSMLGASAELMELVRSRIEAIRVADTE
ncbi:MAG: hypothetical protein R3F19_03070 [Verrucomicrobiales bacterium]